VITFHQCAHFGVFLSVPNDNFLQYSTADIVTIVFIIAEIFFFISTSVCALLMSFSVSI